MTLREDFVRLKARDFLLSRKICNLPVNPFELIARAHLGLVTYRRLSELSGSPDGLPALMKESPDGFTVFSGRNYCIAYNSEVRIFQRQVFTLMHEIGHIVLGHFSSADSSSRLSGCAALEKESNLFASLVMAPSAVIERCGFGTPELLHAACGLSLSASHQRLGDLKNHPEEANDPELERLFASYIRLNRPRRSSISSLDIAFDGGFPVSSAH